jgi:hypothetical protein
MVQFGDLVCRCCAVSPDLRKLTKCTVFVSEARARAESFSKLLSMASTKIKALTNAVATFSLLSLSIAIVIYIGDVMLESVQRTATCSLLIVSLVIPELDPELYSSVYCFFRFFLPTSCQQSFPQPQILTTREPLRLLVLPSLQVQVYSFTGTGAFHTVLTGWKYRGHVSEDTISSVSFVQVTLSSAPIVARTTVGCHLFFGQKAQVFSKGSLGH